MQHLDN